MTGARQNDGIIMKEPNRTTGFWFTTGRWGHASGVGPRTTGKVLTSGNLLPFRDVNDMTAEVKWYAIDSTGQPLTPFL